MFSNQWVVLYAPPKNVEALHPFLITTLQLPGGVVWYLMYHFLHEAFEPMRRIVRSAQDRRGIVPNSSHKVRVEVFWSSGARFISQMTHDCSFKMT